MAHSAPDTQPEAVPALELADVTVAYGTRRVLDRLNMSVPVGGTFVVCGANGSGKSTLLYAAAGLLAPTRGRVRLGGFDTATHPGGELFRRGVRCGFVFQQGGLLSNLTLLANVAMPLAYHRHALGLSPQAIDERARDCLGRVGVGPEYLDALPAYASQGILKRVALARVMALKPNFLFFDDPDAGLERDQAADVDDLVLGMLAGAGATAMLTTTNPDLARRAGGDAFRLADGKLCGVPGANDGSGTDAETAS